MQYMNIVLLSVVTLLKVCHLHSTKQLVTMEQWNGIQCAFAIKTLNIMTVMEAVRREFRRHFNLGYDRVSSACAIREWITNSGGSWLLN